MKIQPPKSYQEINYNRPNKKRTYKYSLAEEEPPSAIATPFSHHNAQHLLQFSFENRPRVSPLHRQSKQSTSRQKIKSSLLEEDDEMSPTRELSKKYEIEQRLNNISSINDKISGLLSIVRHKKNQVKTLFDSPQNQSAPTRNKPYLPASNTSAFTSIYYVDKDPPKTITPFQARQTATFKDENSPVPYSSKDYSIDRIDSSFVTQYQQIKKPSRRIDDIGRGLYLNPLENNQKIAQPLSQLRLSMQTQNQKKEKALQENIALDRQIEQIKHKIFENSPFTPKEHSEPSSSNKKQQLPDLNTFQLTEKPQIMKLAKNLSKLVQGDIQLFPYRQSFSSCKDVQKWKRLQEQLLARNLHFSEPDLKQVVEISIHQKNPFNPRSKEYSLNQVKDLAKLLQQTENIWTQIVDKCVSLDLLAEEEFSLSLIDFNNKGKISLEDLVCFINIHSQQFYRSREVANLFKRLLKLQGKSMSQLSEGINYSTLMQKVAK